jgi:NAD(P)-dependent dehydrogenase (short-subunit alcohol dehydrogenase family)
VVLVTGGSSGLGLETVKRLAAAGATVVLTSRTEAKGKKAIDAVNDYLVKKGRLPTTSEVYNLVLDLDDLSDVRRMASRYEALGLDRDISVLINNAGVMAIPKRELTVDGNERTFQSNHLGHFVLTSVLFPYLSRNGTRVVTVSSSASYFAGPAGLDVDNLNGEKSYGAWSSYSSSKLTNVLFTRELQRRADDADLDWLSATTLHPGVVNTDLWRYIVGEERLSKMKEGRGLGRLAMGVTRLIAKTPEEGASTQVFLAATSDDDIVKGAFYDEMKVNTNLPSFAKDVATARALWDASEKLGGVRFVLGTATTIGAEAVISTDESSGDASSEEKGSEDVDLRCVRKD